MESGYPDTKSSTRKLPTRKSSSNNRLAPASLIVATAVFFLTLGHDGVFALGLLHAFSEAAMIGGLADWFAVVALFRHPFGVPIPHTAIIPRRKDEIGENLAGFVSEHFLHPDVVRARLASVNLAGNAATWLKSPPFSWVH